MKCITIFPGPKGDKNTKKGIEILRGKSRKLEVGIKCTAILTSLGMPRNQNQACSSETPEQTKDSNDTGNKKIEGGLWSRSWKEE